MGVVEVLVDGREAWPMEFRVLCSWAERAAGLLGTGHNAMPVVLTRCASIHTLGMRYAIDVAFVSGDGRVLRSVRGLAPGAVVSCRGSFCVFERPSSDEPWFDVDDRVRMVSVTDEGLYRADGKESCYA